MASWVKKLGSWQEITNISVKTGGIWRTVSKGFVKIQGSWIEFWPFGTAPKISKRVEISRSSSTLPSTLTGKNYHWSNVSSLKYSFQWSYIDTEDDASWLDVATPATILNPATGSFNTKTYIVDDTLFTSTYDTVFFRFVVTGYNTKVPAGIKSISLTTSVTTDAPIGVPGSAVIARQSDSTYVWAVTNNGTWNPTASSYRYQWQQSSTLNGTYSDISGATSSTYDASSYKSKYIRVKIWGLNSSGGESKLPIYSNSMEVTYAKPKINSFSVTGTTGAVIYSYNITSDNPTYTLSLTADKYYSSIGYDGNPDVILSPSGLIATNVTSEYFSQGNYKLTLSITANGFSDSVTSEEVTVTGLSASNLTITDNTPQGSPSGVTVANTSTSNIGRISWTNGTGASSVSVSGTGAVPVTFSSSTQPLDSSYDFVITNSGTENVTVTNTFNPSATVSWDQTGAQSYSLEYSVVTPQGSTGRVTLNANSSASSVSIPFSGNSSSLAINVYALNVYSGLNQTGVPWPGGYAYPASTLSTTANQRTATANGSGTLTKSSTDNTLSNLTISTGTLSPSFNRFTNSYSVTLPSNATSITVTPTAYDSNSTIKVNGISVTSGTASQSISLNVGTTTSISIEVTAQDGSKNTYTVSVGVNGNSIPITLSSATSTSTGFTFSLTAGYDSSWTWTASIKNSPAGVTISPATGSSAGQVYTVSGMGVNTVGTATAVITATKAGYDTSTAERTGNYSAPQVSGFAISDTTVDPLPTSVTVANGVGSNVGTATWTTSATKSAWISAISGSGTADTTEPATVRTSQNFTITSTGYATVTISAKSVAQVTISWNQTGAQSYKLVYNRTGIGGGSQTVNANSSASSVSYPITLSSGDTITLTSITVYDGLNQTGNYGMLTSSSAVTAYDITKTATGAGLVTYTPSSLPAPTFESNVSTSTGFTGAVNNYDTSTVSYSFTTSAGTVTAGTPSLASGRYPFVVSGLTAGQSATVTVTVSKSGYSNNSAQTTGSALTGPNFTVPTFNVPTFNVPLYTVTWNANGGVVSPSTSTQASAGAAVSVPIPSRSLYTWNGWYSAASGGTRIIAPTTTTYTPTANTTLYAQWTAKTTYGYCNKTDAANIGCVESSCIIGGAGGTCTPTPSFPSFATPSFPSFTTPSFPTFTTPSFPTFNTPAFPTFNVPTFNVPSFAAVRKYCNRTDEANTGCTNGVSCGNYSGGAC